jgi:type IV pilus assembly protein PilW
MSLIELMVALGIGTFLIIGALTVHIQSRSTYAINESIARLQENGRYFFDAVEPDIRMARHWGLISEASAIAGRASPTDPTSPLSPENDCGPNWSVNLDDGVSASNGSYGFACPPYGTAASGADTLVVRRASVALIDAPENNTLYIQSSRGAGGALFIGPDIPAPFHRETLEASQESSETRELVVNGYYVSTNSSLDAPGNTVPSLRRKLLRQGGANGPVVVDEEVLPGVEDMQIEFGVDTDPFGDADYGNVDRYIHPDDPTLDEADPAFAAHARILAIRVWLRLRSEWPEPGQAGESSFTYADQHATDVNDGYRRIVVSKTIYLRNAAGAP